MVLRPSRMAITQLNNKRRQRVKRSIYTRSYGAAITRSVAIDIRGFVSCLYYTNRVHIIVPYIKHFTVTYHGRLYIPNVIQKQ